MGLGTPDIFAEDDAPRSMRDPAVRARRRAMLDATHMAPLNEYVANLRQHPEVEVPDFDPLDGGTSAQALFLFEKPGPMTAENSPGKRAGSGFISRNNDDPTAEATFKFMRRADLPRQLTVTWNVVPWWNGTREISRSELQEGVASIQDLMQLLPELRAVVFVGKKAVRARPHFEASRLALFASDHPSPLVRARWPERWHAIPDEWARIKPYLNH